MAPRSDVQIRVNPDTPQENKNLPQAPVTPEMQAERTQLATQNEAQKEQTRATIGVEIANLRKQLESEQDANKKFELQRQIMRLETFSNIQEWKNISDKNLQNEIRKILEWKNTDTYRNVDLLTLKSKGIDIAPLTLVYKNKTDTVSTEKMSENEEFVVNFGGNMSLAQKTGAGDIFPATVRQVEINGVKAERGNNPRPGYYDANGRYVPIYDGYQVKILKMGNATNEDSAAIQQRLTYSEEESRQQALSFNAEVQMNQKGAEVWNNPEFQNRLQAMCSRLKINPEHLKVVMYKESGINPQAHNRNSGATGLIQFMPKTARGLWTTVDALYNMSASQQLEYVEKYYSPYAGKLNSPADLYLATFYPYAIGKSSDFVVGSEIGLAEAREIARQNPGIAKFSNNPNGITVAAFNNYVYA